MKKKILVVSLILGLLSNLVFTNNVLAKTTATKKAVIPTEVNFYIDSNEFGIKGYLPVLGHYYVGDKFNLYRLVETADSKDFYVKVPLISRINIVLRYREDNKPEYVIAKNNKDFIYPNDRTIVAKLPQDIRWKSSGTAVLKPLN